MTIQEKRAVEERILKTASDLFYRQGYRATGVNQVIAESGVAKATFYNHFPAKADLLAAYAEAMSKDEMESLRASLSTARTALDRFFMPFRILPPWFKESDFRGCPFQNIVAEVVADAPEVCETARKHRDLMLALIIELITDLIKEEPACASLNQQRLAETYLLLFEGAIVLSVAYRSDWPVVRAEDTLRGLLSLT